MKKDIRLYIDNELADVTDATDVTLEIKSNLFADVSKMTSNSTLTIKLPKTTHNQRLIANADRIHGGGTYPYEWHRIDFYRNGVQLIRNGKAVVMSIGDDIELSAIWGLMPAFATLQESQLQLNQLKGDYRLLVDKTFLPASFADVNPYNINDAGTCYFLADIDEQLVQDSPNYQWDYDAVTTSSNGQRPPSGGGGGRRPAGQAEGFDSLSGKIYLHPSVRVAWLLDLIAAQTGVTFQWSGDAADYIQSLIIPLVLKKANELSYTSSFVGTLPSGGYSDKGLQTINIITGSNIFAEQSGSTTELTALSSMDIRISATGDYYIDGLPVANPNGQTIEHYRVYPLYYDINLESGGDVEESYVVGRNFADLQGNPRTMDISEYAVTTAGRYSADISGNGRVSIEQGQKLKFYMRIEDNLSYTYHTNGVSLQIDVAGASDYVESGQYFPILSNLPEIKVIDLIKTLCVLTGTFPLQGGGDVVTFVPYSVLNDNKPYAVDWSSRLMPNEAANKPRNTDYKVGEWAQLNWYKWKEDSTTKANVDASIPVDNETLDATRDVITLPFAATDGDIIPMYTLSDDGTKVTYKACQPRLIRLIEDTSKTPSTAKGWFDIDLTAIIGERYGVLMQMLDDARVLKEHFALSDVDILNFDESKPVYIRQYGAYFAVTKITAKDNGIAEVEMVQINEI